jgi:hypothetical protein
VKGKWSIKWQVNPANQSPTRISGSLIADETDELGLKVARVTFSYGDNDKKLIRHRCARCIIASMPRARAIYRTRR